MSVAKATGDEPPAKRQMTTAVEREDQESQYLAQLGGQEELEAAIKVWMKCVKGAPRRSLGAIKPIPYEIVILPPPTRFAPLDETLCTHPAIGVGSAREAWEGIDRLVCGASRKPKGFGLLRQLESGEHALLASTILECNSALGQEGPRRKIVKLRVEVEEGDEGGHIDEGEYFHEGSHYTKAALIDTPGAHPIAGLANLTIYGAEEEDMPCKPFLFNKAFPVFSKAVAFSASAPLPSDLTRLVLDYYGLEKPGRHTDENEESGDEGEDEEEEEGEEDEVFE